MNPDKQIIVDELLTRVNGSPFLLVVNYTGMTVPEFNELRGRLREGGAECHVAKNSYMKRALESAGMSGLEEILQGQTAFITGEEDVCGAAKAVANFVKEFKKPEVKAGLTKQMLEGVSVQVAPHMKKGYEVAYLGNLTQAGCEVHLWKVTYQDGHDDTLARLVLKGRNVAGFWLQ